jgi:hypothetical protein
VKDAFEAAVGRASNDLSLALRNFRSERRASQPESASAAYSKEQTAAAQDVIRNLALVDKEFSNCRLSFPIPHCECCNDPDFLNRLATTPLAELDEDDVATVAESLLYTLGTAADFAYFIPRFCSDSLGYPLYDVEAIFARFERAGFFEWPESQRVAVRNFVLSHWHFLLLTVPSSDTRSMIDPFFVILDCIASLGNIDPALHIWARTYDRSADERLLELVRKLDVGDDHFAIVGVGGYADSDGQYELLGDWIASQPIRARIEAALNNVALAEDGKASVLRSLSAVEDRSARRRRAS